MTSFVYFLAAFAAKKYYKIVIPAKAGIQFLVSV